MKDIKLIFLNSELFRIIQRQRILMKFKVLLNLQQFFFFQEDILDFKSLINVMTSWNGCVSNSDICYLSNEGWGSKYHCTASHFHPPILFFQDSFVFYNGKVSNIHISSYNHNFNNQSLFFYLELYLSVVLIASPILGFNFYLSFK